MGKLTRARASKSDSSPLGSTRMETDNSWPSVVERGQTLIVPPASGDGGLCRTKNPGAARRQGRGVLEQTDSPLALFFVVAISWARQDPKSIHVNCRVTLMRGGGNREVVAGYWPEKSCVEQVTF